MKTDSNQEDRTEGPILPEGIGHFNERLKELIGQESMRAFGRRVGISDTTIRKYLTGETEPTLSRLAAIAVACDICVEWLVTGEGPKEPLPDSWWLNSEIDTKAKEQEAWNKQAIAAKQRQDSALDEEYALIEGYHVAVSTGHGAFGEAAEVTRRLAFRKRWLNFRGFRPDQLKVVFARGDSMEPTIKDNDSLLVNLASIDPIDGKIFVVRLGDQLYAKRIQKRWDGGIELISDNKEYSTQVIPAAELEHLQVIGQVVWIGKDIS